MAMNQILLKHYSHKHSILIRSGWCLGHSNISILFFFSPFVLDFLGINVIMYDSVFSRQTDDLTFDTGILIFFFKCI